MLFESEMDKKVFDKFRELIHRESGIYLSERKVSLLSSRILKRLRALGLQNAKQYLAYVEKDNSGTELMRLLDVISTNTTHFYREGKHFDFLSNVIFAKYHASGQKTVRLWCAASSSGEEPYTIAICAREALDLARCDFRMLATDICTDVLQHAVEGRYSEQQFREMPSAIKKKYFKKVGDGSAWQVDPKIRDMVLFKKLNLSNFPWPLRGKFDVIFCRNVMIYFDNALRQQLTNSFYDHLNDGGYFFVSHSESLSRVQHKFERIEGSVYRKKGR